METLAAVAAARGQRTNLTQRQLTESSSPLLDALAQRVAPNARLQTGVATDALVRELQKKLCGEPSVREWLPATCAPLPGRDTLIELRRRIVQDAVLLALKAANEAPPMADQTEALRLVSALMVGSLESVEPYHLAARMAGAMPPGPDGQPCTEGGGPVELPPGNGDKAKVAARILGTLSLDGPDFSRPSQHYARVVARVLQEEGVLAPDQALTAEQEVPVGRLVTALGNARDVGQRLRREPADEALARSLLTDWAVIVQEAMTLAVGRTYQLPPAWPGVLDALVAADVARMAEAVVSMVPDTTPVPAKVIRAIDFAVRFAAAETDAERKRLLGRYLVGLAPWTEPILFDINLGTVIVDVKSLNAEFAGDLAIGYNAGLGGGIIRGSAYGYEYSEQGVSSSNTYRVGADIEGWIAPGNDEIKADFRLKAGYARFDTDVAGEAAGNDAFSDETSDTGRATLLAGVRLTPSSRFAIGAWGGGGGQFEDYNALVVDANNDVFIDDGQKLTAKADGRLRMQATIWPRVLVGRLRADLEWFKLSTTGFELDALAGTSVPVTVELQQLEIETRAFIDLEAARFVGFVPSINAGVNYISVSSSDGPSESTVVPVIAAGVRRDVF